MSAALRPFASALLSLAVAAPCRGQLPPPFVPPGNAQTGPKVALGKVLFWDEQLSSDDSVACGTCHRPEFGGSDGRLAFGRHPGPDGVRGTADDVHGSAGLVRQLANGDFVPIAPFELARQVTKRTSPTTHGAAYHDELFWDGRADSQFVDPETGLLLLPAGAALENQALAPILNPVEMAHEGRTWADVRAKLQAAQPLALAYNLPADVQAALQQNPSYPSLFAAAFGDPAITAARIAFALAAYQRTLVPDDTPWDRYQLGNQGAMTQTEKTGWSLFQNQGNCSACHWAPLFSDDMVHSLGLRPAAEDPGRMLVSGHPFDAGAFKTPTLRNAGLRPRLFHNGQSPPLGDPLQLGDPASTLNVYLQGGGVDTSNLDPFLAPLALHGVAAHDVWLMQEFVRTALTDQRAALRLPPFDHPDLRSAVVAPPRVFGPALAGAREPVLTDSVPSFPGNAAFRLGIAGGDGPGLAVVAYGFSSFEPHATVLGLPWHVAGHDFVPFALGGQPGGPGHATWRLPIPGDPSLALVPFFFQVLVADAQAPGGIAASRGYEFFVVD